MSSTEARAQGRARLCPIVARSVRLDTPTGATSYTRVRLSFLRSGSATIHGDFPRQRVRAGDLVVVAPSTVCGGEPDRGGVVSTTLYLDADFMTDLALWQSLAGPGERHEPWLHQSTNHSEPLRTFHLGVPTILRLEPWLDELTDLCAQGLVQGRFLRAAALLFSILDVVETAIATGPRELPGVRQAGPGPSRPWQHGLQPLPTDASRAAGLLHSSLERKWTLADLAQEVGLSPNRLRQLFTQSYGNTPLAYQNMLRAQRMAQLLHDPALSIPEAMRQVGWTSPSHAARMFRRHLGMSPRQYRTRRHPR